MEDNTRPCYADVSDMTLKRVLCLPRHCWKLLKVACVVVIVIHIYLLVSPLSQQSKVQMKSSHHVTGINGVLRRKIQHHPFAHLLPHHSLSSHDKKCTQPKLSLTHDALAFAFSPLKPLECSGSHLFYLHEGYLIPNKTTLSSKKLEKCELSVVKRDSDMLSVTEKIADIYGNSSVRVDHDFIYIRCYFSDENNETNDVSVLSDSSSNKNTDSTPGNSHNEPEQNATENMSDQKRSNMSIPRSSTEIHELQLATAVRNGSSILGTNQPSKNSKRDYSVKQHVNSKENSLKLVNLTRSSNTVAGNETPVKKKGTLSSNVLKHKNTDAQNLRDSIYHSSQGSRLTSSISNSKQGIAVMIKEKSFDKEKTQHGDSADLTVRPDVKHVNKQTHPSSAKLKEGASHGNSMHENEVRKGESVLSSVMNKRRFSRRRLKSVEGEKVPSMDEGEQEGLDEDNEDRNNDGLDGDPDDFRERWDSEEWDLDPWYAFGMYDVPSCEDEQFLVQVSPHRYVFERHKKAKRPKGASGLNILMFGIDSMSHMNMKRKLPLTLKFLRQELGAVVFDGYNIVGDATTQAILPIFTGKVEQEIPGLMDQTLDDLNFVWKRYKKQGYATVFAEDEPHLGVFNLRLKGFDRIPTDHYMRYFWQARAESHLKFSCSEKFCTGPTPNHQFLLQYLEDFFHKYRNISRFAVGFSGELSHDEVNPSEYLDADLKDFLSRLRTKGYLKDTVVIVFSDHGSRKGKLRQTLQGKIEERMPFLAMVFPDSFKTQQHKMYTNLVRNAKGLTSPFDLHATLVDLLDLSKVNVTNRTPKKRGVSLFRPIPEDRTCRQAGIDTHWCTCMQETPVPPHEPVVKGAAQAVVATINKLTQADRQQCVPLTLNLTRSASIVVPDLKLLKFYKTEEKGNFSVKYGNVTTDMAEFQVTVETDMCGGVFEATVQVRYRKDVTEGTDETSEEPKLSYYVYEKDISRIDTYGIQSACICKSNPQIMKFCCCRAYLQGERLNSC